MSNMDLNNTNFGNADFTSPGFKKSEIPWQYAACMKEDCVMANTCLRSKVWDTLADTDRKAVVINPQLATGNKDCTEFRSSVPVKYAIGFKNFREKMLPRQYSKFMNICVNYFGRNSYFIRRRGERPIPPSEQRFIYAALRKSGVTETFDFDDYEYLIDWSGR